MSDDVVDISVMGKAHVEATVPQPILTTSDAPDWDRVPFDVACARCGEDLRGQTEPVCSACGLTFDWSDAVPLEELICEECGYHLYGLSETRCPECGEQFTWEAALAAHTRRKSPMFEYHWRRRPVRLFAKSMFLALRPTRLWQRIDIHDRPPVPGLVCLALVSMLFAAGVVMVALTANQWIAAGRWVRMPSGQWTPGPLRFSALWPAMLRSLPAMYVVVSAIIAWCVSGFLSLLVLRQSMRLCKVRAGHVARVWAYAVPVATAWCAAAYSILSVADYTVRAWYPGSHIAHLLRDYRDWVYGVILPVGFGALAVWSIRCGYRHYIGMRHAFWVAISTQAIAFFATLTTLLVLGSLLHFLAAF